MIQPKFIPAGATLALKILANAIVVGGIGYVFARSLQGRGAEVLLALQSIPVATLAAIAAAGVVFNLVLHQGWLVVTRTLRIDLPYGESLAIWTFSLLGKYIPGKVVIILSRVWFYRQRGRSALWVGYGVLLEHFLAMAAGGAVAVLALSVTDVPEFQAYRVLGWVSFVGLAVVLSPRFLNGITGVVTRRLHLGPLPLLRAKHVLRMFTLYLFAWCWLGLGNFLLIQALSGVSWRYVLYLAGAHALAGIVGTLALFAPTGIGVKESVMFVLFSRIMPAYEASLVTLALRVWLTTTELSLGAIGWGFSRRTMRFGVGVSDPASAKPIQQAPSAPLR